ncbi:phage terminase large subunit [Mesorhizobium sp. 10J20-29]
MTQSPELFRELQRHEFFAFYWTMFEYLHPGQRFLSAWHAEAICYALSNVAAGKTKRLAITVPPRHGKSLCTSVALPAWMLGHDPSLKIMVSSYGGDLASKHAQGFREVLTSDWYKALFPSTRLAIGGNRMEEQITTRQGGRKAISLGGAATGFGADLIIVDDLMKADDANSPAELQRVRNHYEQTLVSRLNDKTDGRIIVIQQRLHEDDLPGYLMATNRFQQLNLPAISIRDELIAIGPNRSKKRLKGEPLWPEREPLETLNAIRIEMGNAAFSAQYQQDPTPPGGNRIRWEWFGTHSFGHGDRADFQHIAQSWDTGGTAEPSSDFSVGTTWGYHDQKWHLLDLVRQRFDFPELKRRVLLEANRWRADMILIEQAGSGISLIQQLRHDDPRQRYSGITPRVGKDARVEAETARLETGNYLVPTEAPWLDTLRQELQAFPNGRYDDQVDSVIQFVSWSASRRGEVFERDPRTGRRLRINRPKFTHRRE